MFIVYPKFKFPWASRVLAGNPVKAIGLLSVSFTGSLCLAVTDRRPDPGYSGDVQALDGQCGNPRCRAMEMQNQNDLCSPGANRLRGLWPPSVPLSLPCVHPELPSGFADLQLRARRKS